MTYCLIRSVSKNSKYFEKFSKYPFRNRIKFFLSATFIVSILPLSLALSHL